MTNAQYYEKISNRISVDKAVGITRIHKVAVQAAAKKLFTKKVEDLKEEELHQAEEMAEESYIAYIMIMNSAAQHDKLKVSLTDDYAKGQDTYPKNRHKALRLLDAFTKTAAPRTIVSEGTSFATAAKPSSKQSSEEYWKDKECYKCGEKGHPARRCPNDDKDKKKKKGKKGKDGDDSDNESRSSKRSFKSAKSKSSKGSSFEKERAKLMASTEYSMAQLKEEYDISDCSDDDTH
jgi:Zinc knuckle